MPFEHGYALLIGVDENSVPAWALHDVSKDVQALAQVLVHEQRCAYLPEHVRVVVDRRGKVGLQGHGARVALPRRLQVALREQGDAQLVVKDRHVRRELDGPAMRLDGFVDPLQA